MKIILATSLYPPEIAEPAPYVKELALQFQNKHKINIITYANEIEKIENIEIIKIKKILPLFWRILKFNLKLFQISKNNSLIYVQNSISVSLPSLIVAKIKKIPFILRFMEDEAWNRSRYLKLTNQSLESYLKNPHHNFKISLIKSLQKYILKKSDKVIVSSAQMKKIIIDNYKINSEKIIINYDPIPKLKILRLENEINNFRLILIDSLETQSELKEIIKLITKLKDNFENIELNIISEKENKKELKQIIKENNLKNKIKFLEHISQAEKEYLIKNSCGIIINSKKEHNPNLILQAFSLSTPVIASNTSLYQEIIKNNYNGFIFSNKEELKKIINQLFTEQNKFQEITSRAKQDLKNKYSWDQHLKILSNLFEKYAK